MTPSTLWLIIKAIAAVVPLIIQMVMEKKITSAAQDDILFDLTLEFEGRLADAKAAGEKELINEADDPYNRARSRSQSVG